ncbi:MAG: phage head-tail connector protein [Acidiferrobacterales bacterium]
MTDYTTLATVKTRLGITDTNDDTTLSTLITAASNAVDRWCKRAFGGFVGSVEARVFDVHATMAGPLRVARSTGDFGGGGFIVGIPTGFTSIVEIDPLLSVTAVATDTSGNGVYDTTWLTTDYNLMPPNAALDGLPYRQIRSSEQGAQQFPVGQRRLQITGTWGEATATPPVIQEATILTVVRWFKRKDAPFGITGDLALGVVKLSPMDPDVKRMLEDAGYVDYWFFE